MVDSLLGLACYPQCCSLELIQILETTSPLVSKFLSDWGNCITSYFLKVIWAAFRLDLL